MQFNVVPSSCLPAVRTEFLPPSQEEERNTTTKHYEASGFVGFTKYQIKVRSHTYTPLESEPGARSEDSLEFIVELHGKKAVVGRALLPTDWRNSTGLVEIYESTVPEATLRKLLSKLIPRGTRISNT